MAHITSSLSIALEWQIEHCIEIQYSALCALLYTAHFDRFSSKIVVLC